LTLIEDKNKVKMENVIALGLPGGPEWILIVLVIIIFFGAKKIPEIARGFGKGIREFKDATKEIKTEIEDTANEAKKD